MSHPFRKNRRFSDAEAEAFLVELLTGKKTPAKLAREHSIDPKIFRQMLRGESYADLRPDLQRRLKVVDEEAEVGAVRNEDESQLGAYRRLLLRDRKRRREDERAARREEAERERAELREARRKLAARTGSGTP